VGAPNNRVLAPALDPPLMDARGLEVTAEAATANEPVVTAENTLETAPAATAPSSARASSSASAPASAPAPARSFQDPEQSEDQLYLRLPSSVLRHAMRAMELASEDGDSAVKHELELLLAAASRPPLADPQVRSRGSRRISFASVPEESSEEGNEEESERVRVWLRETLTSPSSAIQESARSGPAPDARRQRARSKELASPTSLWVLPEAMAMALSGELFDEPLTISDSARADAMACLDTWDYDTLALQEASGGHALLLVGEALFE